MSISIIVLTLNEESNIKNCLNALQWSDDIVILDSGSTDKTLEIAKEFNVNIVNRKLDNWASHHNYMVSEIEYKHPWVYYSDADEIVTEDLAQEMIEICSNSDLEEVAYRVRFKNMFMGKWIKRSSMYPTWILRLFKPEFVHWERLVNPTPIVNGKVGRLENHFLHYSFNKGLSAWFDKHNKYSDQEALETIKSSNNNLFKPLEIFSLDGPNRRAALKELSFRLPARCFFKFIYMYFMRMGFLDGQPGFYYCLMQSYYEFMISMKVKEIRRREKGLSV
jgi:glycosyltransferase involved in cell wall biosynthesis